MSLDRQHDQATTARDISEQPGITHWLGKPRAEQVRQALQAGGVDMTESNTGRLQVGKMSATVALEVNETLCIRGAIEDPKDPRELLEHCADYPGNVRIAAARQGLQLAAETRIDGVVHLSESLGEISSAFSRALRPKPGAEAGDVPDDLPLAESVRAAISSAGWTSDDAVETPVGWEVRPRLEGTHVAVQVAVHRTSVNLRRVLIRDVPEGSAGRAVAHQALACNERLRGSRLAIAGKQLVAECQLRPDLVDGEWLPFAARAVAAAARSLEPVLRVLADEAAVAEAYCDMFLSPKRRRGKVRTARKSKKTGGN